MSNQETKGQENYFNPEKYNTIIVKKTNDQNSPTKKNDLLSGLRSIETKNDILKLLREEGKGKDILIGALISSSSTEDKATITAACWESGIDFSDQIDHFLEITLNEELPVVIEAITVIENIEPSKLKKMEPEIRKKLSDSAGNKNERGQLIKDLLSYINSL